jgi:hypothetical protein
VEHNDMHDKIFALVVSGLIASPALAQMAPPEGVPPSQATIVPAQGTPSPAPELKLPRFGREGQFVLGGATRGLLAGKHMSGSGGSYDRFTGSIDALVGTFVANNLFLGTRVGAAYNGAGIGERGAEGPQQESIQADVGPVIGVNLPLTDIVSVFPTLGASYRYSYAYNNTDVVKAHNIFVSAGVDFVLPIVEHMSLTVGPFVARDIFGRQRAETGSPVVGTDGDLPSLTTYGVKLGLLGWM